MNIGNPILSIACIQLIAPSVMVLVHPHGHMSHHLIT